MNKKPDKVYVWPLGTRIVHWMLALSFATAFFTSFHAELLHYHVALGFIFLIIIIHRIIWGFIGPRYATFRTFKLSLPELKHYFVEKIQNRWRKIPAGHNPASSWFTLWALGMGTIIVLSGVLLYGIQEAKGIFSFLNTSHSSYMGLVDAVHQYTSYIFVAWVMIHITGVLIEQFWHKTDMVFAMITGYKKTEGQDTEVSKKLTFFAFFMIFFALGTYIYIIKSDSSLLTKSQYSAIDYAQQHPTFAKECSECHNLYPPFLLPAQSWKKIMGRLDNHFGEEITDANISKAQQKSILKFLTQNSAETSNREVSVKVMKTLGERRPKAFTKTPYYRETHQHIPRSVFKTKEIKDKSNCVACHKNFEEGNLDNNNIKHNY